MEFQQRLYELRKQSGLSQEGLADLLGVSRQAVQKWEAGTSRPDLDNLTGSFPHTSWRSQISHAKKIGLGEDSYELITI